MKGFTFSKEAVVKALKRCLPQPSQMHTVEYFGFNHDVYTQLLLLSINALHHCTFDTCVNVRITIIRHHFSATFHAAAVFVNLHHPHYFDIIYLQDNYAQHSNTVHK